MALVRKSNTVDERGVVGAIWYACGVADALRRLILDKDTTVTSMRDSIHGANSLHPMGRAVDLRTRDLTKADREFFHGQLKKVLEPQGFDVVMEVDHEHIEFDPKKGEAFFPVKP